MENEDLIWEILVRLPSKSLMKFKCVSKLWNSIICNPKFAIYYSNGGSCFRGLLIRDGNLICRYLYMNLNDCPTLKQHHLYHQPVYSRATTVVKGLIGLFYIFRNNFTLCNIATNQLLELPPSPTPPANYDIRFYNYFIGFDVVKEVFKVFNECFCFGDGYSVKCTLVHIFTLGVNDSDINWRKIVEPLDLCFHDNQQCLCINGSLYWLPFKGKCQQTLIVFHLNNETFETIAIPECTNNNADLVEICGKAALVVSYVEKLDVWTMNNNLWSKKKVELPTRLYPNRSLEYGGTLPTGSIILVHCTSDDNSHCNILIYDHECNTITVEGYESQDSGFNLQKRWNLGKRMVYYYEDNIISLDRLMSNHEHDQTITGN